MPSVIASFNVMVLTINIPIFFFFLGSEKNIIAESEIYYK